MFNVDGEKIVDKKFIIDILPKAITIFNDIDFVVYIKQIISRCDEIFEEAKTSHKIEHKDEVMDIYFKLLEYSAISDYFGPTHRLILKKEKDVISIHMMCLDASDFLLETIENSIKSIVFFSATLTPFAQSRGRDWSQHPRQNARGRRRSSDRSTNRRRRRRYTSCSRRGGRRFRRFPSGS